MRVLPVIQSFSPLTPDFLIMIIRETELTFICIAQHDHAYISGQLAEYWKEGFFWKSAHKEDVLLAIYQHDRGWINLDNTPAWDEVTGKPYSFVGYPQEQKLAHYIQGIDEVEAENLYAAILCSMHYASFISKHSSSESIFLEHEEARQIRLKKQVKIDSAEKEILLAYHFHLLQLFDDLSLYMCIHEPGVAKESEHPFFRSGFKNTDRFAFTAGHKIKASWKNSQNITVSPFPLTKEVQVWVPYREINKKEINLSGLATAYNKTLLQNYKLIISE
jgi:hypothetical protein